MKNIIKIAICLFCLISLNSKAQWSESLSPSDFTNFDQIDYVSEDTIWGTEFNGVVISTDRGKTFIRRSSKYLKTTNIFHVNQNWYYTFGGLFVSKDYGFTWSKVQIKDSLGDTIYKGLVHQAHIFENGQGFALGTDVAGSFRLFYTKNNGENWVEQDSNLVNLKNYVSGNSPIFVGKVYCFDSTCIAWNNLEKNKFWVFSNYGKIVNEVDLNLIIPNDIRSFAFSDNLNGMFITTNQNVYSFNNGLGSLKLVGNAPASGALDFAKKSDKNRSFYIVGSPITEGSFYSLDTGKTWLSIGDMSGHFFIKMLNSSIGISSINSDIQAKIKTFNLVLNSITENKGHTDFLVSPNPTKSKILLSGISSPENYFVLIKNMNGELVQFEKNNAEIDLSSLPTGIYILTLTTYNHYVVKKIIKE